MTDGIDIEAIAAQIHEFYRTLAAREGWTLEYSMPYPALPEHMKEDNREAARRIGQVLALAGLMLVPREGERWAERDQDAIGELIEKNLELLAEGEHDGWVEARLRHGWRVHGYRNSEERLHHLLVPYLRFAEQIEKYQQHEASQGRPPKRSVDQAVAQEKSKDRDSVSNYVKIIAQTKYRIVREGD
ncbi:MAG: RyR domain-containing protein [Gemmatimonadales bacterium]